MSQALLSQKIHSQVNQANNILLVSHQQPDADALGSLAAFGEWLDILGKTHTKFCQDLPPANLAWLLNFQPIAINPDLLIRQNYDLVVVLDCGDLKHAGLAKILSDFTLEPFVINIDHHATNQNFGDINLVDEEAVSTTAIIYQLFKSLNHKVSRQTAGALLAGIIYDSYNFTNPNTNHLALAAAADLLLAGASLPQVSNSILKNKSLETLRIWGEILIRLRYNPQFGLATTVITRDDLADYSAVAEISEGVANFLNNLAGIKAALILQQQEDNIIKGSLRTNDDLIDVSKLAKILGGGGHKKAAGFKIKGQLVKLPDGNWQIV